jgi:uncharacterized membrane protein YphA (DoxX/SURF4 family)
LLALPAVDAVSTTLAPLIEALLRVIVGLALVPHGLRVTFGWFRNSGLPASNLKMLTAQLDRDGYRPGPLLALGLFTRIAAVPVVIFLAVSCRERWVKGGWFWNTQGLEYTLMWTVAAAYFLARGGGMYSLDYWLGL